MNYIRIDKDDVCNGNGLRVVLWLSGCAHHCVGCQNPQTWDADNGSLFDEDAKCEIFSCLEKEYISGITISGGDPLYEGNLDGVLKLVSDINHKFNSSGRIKTIWLYTGYTWEDLFNSGAYTSVDHPGLKRRNIVKQCDVLIDGQYIESLRDVTLPWRGSSNQRIIDVKKSLLNGEIVLLH